MRRKNVPYSGPLAPPTVLTSVIPADLSSAAGAASGAASSLPTTAFIPRRMFEPWSASPISESSLVSSSAWSVTSSANVRSQRPELGRAHRLRHSQTPHRNATVLIGASQRRSSSSSSLSSETEAPAMSRLVK